MKYNFRKKRSWRTAMPVLLLVAGALGGCKTHAPLTSDFPAPASSANRTMVCDFESASPTNINPNLFDAGTPPGHTLANPGSVFDGTATGVSVMSAGPVTGGAEGSGNSYACNGFIVDLGNGVYPAFSIQAWFKSTHAAYDMGVFSGIQYDLKVESDDTAAWRELQIPLASTWPVSYGGTCAANCYDHFSTSYSSTAGAWMKVTHAFADFKRQGFGGPLTPADLSGTNLQQALLLQWVEGNQNMPGTIVFDFSVDQIQFY